MELPDPAKPLGIPTGFGPSGRAGAPPVQRVRLTFVKGPALRFIGHLDLARMWERAFRRARLPLAYTLGYTPHPRLTFAAPLALGATGGAELLEVYLREQVSHTDLLGRLRSQLPEGCEVISAQDVDLLGPSASALTRWAVYSVEASAAHAGAGEAETVPDRVRDHSRSVEAPSDGGAPLDVPSQGSRWSSRGAAPPAAESTERVPALGEEPWRPASQRLASPLPDPALPPLEEVRDAIRALLDAPSLPRARHRDGKTTNYDLRPLVDSVWIESYPGVEALGAESVATDALCVRLAMRLRHDSNGAGRPDEVTAALGLRARRIHRAFIVLEDDKEIGNRQ